MTNTEGGTATRKVTGSQSQGLHATVISSSSAQQNYDSARDISSWGAETGVYMFTVTHVYSKCILCSFAYLTLQKLASVTFS